MPDVTADNLTLDEETEWDDQPADAAADNTAEKSTCINKDSSKWKSTGTAPSKVKRSKHSADYDIDINRCCVRFGMYADDAGSGRGG